MDCNEPARIVRGGDPCVELRLAEGRSARFALAPVIVRVEFDDIGTRGDLVANGADRLVDACDLLRALRNRDAGLIALGTVSAPSDDRLG